MAPSQASPNTVTFVISLPSIGLAWPVHRLHLKLASDFRRPGMPLHFLWIQLEQPPQKMEFVRMPLRPMPLGSLPEFWSTSSPEPDISTLVLPMSTQSPFPSMLVFQRISFYCNSSKESVMMTKSSAYRFSQGHPVWNSWERASRTVINSKGLNSLGEVPLSHWNLLLVFSCMPCVSLTSHSSTPSLWRAHQMTCLGMRSNVNGLLVGYRGGGQNISPCIMLGPVREIWEYLREISGNSQGK